MKIFISADIEGTNGITHWDETDRSKSEYHPFAKRMTLEVAAVCEGINKFGADEIMVKDAHAGGRNIDHDLLPENVWLNRAFSGHPHSMMDLIDNTYSASMLVGYHSPAYSGGSPLAHTMSGIYSKVTINGINTSEFLLAYYTSLYHGVPMVLVAGDEMLMGIVKETDPDIITVETMRGRGASVTSMHPLKTRRLLTESAEKAMQNISKLKAKKLPETFEIEIRYRDHQRAFSASNYPGAIKKDAQTVAFTAKDYIEILRFMKFN